MEADPSGEVYEELRPLAFSIAYRMLGSATEAGDGRIQRVNSVVNPEKLTRLTAAP